MSRPTRLSRRGALGVSAGAVLLAGCRDVPVEQTRPGALATATGTGPATPREDPDADLLRTALALEATQVARLERVQELPLRPPSARLVAAALRVHRAHVQLLRGDDAAPVVPDPAAPAVRLLARLPATELVIAEQHASAATTAASGPFARVLASLAAAARQQAQVLGDLEVR